MNSASTFVLMSWHEAKPLAYGMLSLSYSLVLFINDLLTEDLTYSGLVITQLSPFGLQLFAVCHTMTMHRYTLLIDILLCRCGETSEHKGKGICRDFVNLSTRTHFKLKGSITWHYDWTPALALKSPFEHQAKLNGLVLIKKTSYLFPH